MNLWLMQLTERGPDSPAAALTPGPATEDSAFKALPLSSSVLTTCSPQLWPYVESFISHLEMKGVTHLLFFFFNPQTFPFDHCTPAVPRWWHALCIGLPLLFKLVWFTSEPLQTDSLFGLMRCSQLQLVNERESHSFQGRLKHLKMGLSFVFLAKTHCA